MVSIYTQMMGINPHVGEWNRLSNLSSGDRQNSPSKPGLGGSIIAPACVCTFGEIAVRGHHKPHKK